MLNLPNDLNSLNVLLLKLRNDKRQALLVLDHFKEEKRSELEDKYIAKPAEEARANGKSKEEIEQIKLKGRPIAEEEFKKAYDKKEKEFLLGIVKKIKDIKKKINDLENQNMVDTINDAISNSQKKENPENQRKAQERFEMNY